MTHAGSPMLAIALGFALLLLWAAVGKARDLAGFRAVLADYRIVPAPLLAMATVGVPAVEAAIAASWLVAPWSSSAMVWASSMTTLLMLVYGGAVAANLVRGRSWIDCGCGAGESVAWPMVARNAVLAVLAALPLAIVEAPPPGPLDLAMSLPLLALAALVYHAGNALIRNAVLLRT